MGNPGRHPPITRFSRSLMERLARPAVAGNRLLVTRFTAGEPGQAPSPSSKSCGKDITSFVNTVVGSPGHQHRTTCLMECRSFASRHLHSALLNRFAFLHSLCLGGFQ